MLIIGLPTPYDWGQIQDMFPPYSLTKMLIGIAVIALAIAVFVYAKRRKLRKNYNITPTDLTMEQLYASVTERYAKAGISMRNLVSSDLGSKESAHEEDKKRSYYVQGVPSIMGNLWSEVLERKMK